MFGFKVMAVVTLSLFLVSGGVVMRGAAKKHDPPTIEGWRSVNSTGDLKVLAEGFHSSLTTPFVAVVRDGETYAAFLKVEKSLPKLDDDFFKSSIVVAAFLGERNTGGYSVEITLEGKNGIRVREKAPAKGVMVPEMITYPFKVVSVALAGASPVAVALDDLKNVQTQPYGLTSGTFTMSGGIAGRVEAFGLEGRVNVMRVGRLATFSFLLKNTGETNQHLLVDWATGIVASDGTVTIPKLSAMTLVNQPNSGLSAAGSFSHHDNTLVLEFASLPSTMIADGFGGGGKIEALAIGSAAKP